MSPEIRTEGVPPELVGERVDKAVAVLASVPRSVARAMIDAGAVTLDEHPVRPSDKVKAGASISFPTSAPSETVTPDPTVVFGVLFEDEHLAVIAKPAGLVVHRGAGHHAGTLVNGLVAQYPHIVGVGENPRWGIVHRLDRDTSGAMLVALTKEAHRRLSANIKERLVHRHYLALVSGLFPIDTGTVDAPIGRDPHAPTKMGVVVDGKYARTHYRRVAEWPSDDVSLLEVQLETGRTHQIRVHLAAIDHSVIGDGLYRPGRDRVESPRIFLHARRLEFEHPVSGEPLTVEAPLPSDLEAVLSGLGPSEL